MADTAHEPRLITETGIDQRIAEIIEPVLTGMGYVLVRVRLSNQNGMTLQVMAERPDTRQLNIDDCADLSRRISDRLDELEAAGRDPIPEAYRLEVSSPGIDRPLTRLKDFEDWKGHEARITLAEKIDGRKQFKGDLAGVAGETIAITDGQGVTHSIAFASIEDAKLVITDRLIAATRPLSTEGADEFEAEEQD